MSKSEAHEASKVKVLAQEADCAAPTRTHAHTRTHSGRVQEKERDGQRARHAGTHTNRAHDKARVVA